MQRRKFIASIGSVAAGAAAVTGTGAFTSASAEREVNVAVATDENAFLGLEPTDSRASLESDQLKLDFEGSNNGAQGLNPNARTAFTDLFEITNQGDDPVYVGVGLKENDVFKNPSNNPNAVPHLFDFDELSGFVYAEENGSGPGLSFNGGNGNMGIDSGGRVDVDFRSNGSADPSNNPRIISPGNSINVDLTIITDESTSLGSDGGKRITVAAANPNSDRAQDGSGT
jgi:hypothetical protein